MGIKPNKKNKNGKGKQGPKLTLEKSSKGEIIAAIVVFSIFFLKTAFDSISYFISQHSTPPAASETANNISANQQNNLQSLNNSESAPPQGGNSEQNVQQDANSIYQQTVQMNGNKPAPNAQDNLSDSTGGIDIMAKAPTRPRTGKMVLISVAESGRSNPFLPAAENFVPKAISKLHLPPPPKQVYINSPAAKIMTTTISGIMYDRYSPSAIIKISGSDYLVKRGDVVNGYRVLAINPNQVIVQAGNNVYKAGVGQILSLSDIKFNAIANLNRKFGGNVAVNKRIRKH